MNDNGLGARLGLLGWLGCEVYFIALESSSQPLPLLLLGIIMGKGWRPTGSLSSVVLLDEAIGGAGMLLEKKPLVSSVRGDWCWILGLTSQQIVGTWAGVIGVARVC